MEKKNIKTTFTPKLNLRMAILVVMACLFSFSAWAQTTGDNSQPTSDGGTNSDNVFADRCSVSGCAKMYPEDNISQLHHKYESAGNPCAFNNCAAGDIGGCSYGSSQLECTQGSLKNFLKTLQASSPSIWQQLGGGTVEQMNARACAAPATDFSSKWKNICKSSQNAAAFEAVQEKYMQKTYYDTAASTIKKKFGIDFNAMAPELQMALFSAAVALGSPGGVTNLMNSIKNNIGDPAQMTEEELLQAMYSRRDYFYSKSSASVRASVQKRNAREGYEALESLKIREAWEEEQKKPKNQQKSYEEIVKEVTGRDACSGNQSGSYNCNASGASGGSGSGGGSSGGSSGGSGSGGSGGGGSGGGSVDGGDSDASGGRSDKNCAPSQYRLSYGSCLMCPLFQVIFNTASLIAKLTFEKLALPVMTVVLLAWALWIAAQILSFISSFETKDAPTLIKTLLNKSFVVLIVVVFLSGDSASFFSMLMEPIFNTGFKLAQLASSGDSCSGQYTVMQDGGLPPSMGQSILCALESIQKRLLDTLSLGAATMCIALYVKGSYFIFPSFPYLFSGLLIFIGAGIVILIFPFLLLDSIFQLTVACALLPAAIGAYPFKNTNQYVKKVWNIFMNAIFNFVFLSLVIFILTTAIENTLSSSGVGQITDSNFQESILTVLVWGGVAILKIVFILLLTWVILEEVNTYADQFAPSMVPGGMGRSVGGMAAGGTKQMGKAAWGGAKSVGGVIKESAQEKIGDMRRNAQMKHLEKHGQAQEITDKDGNVIGRTYTISGSSWLKGRQKAKTLTVMNNGTKMISNTKDYGNGKIVTTRSDGYLKQTETQVLDEKTGQYTTESKLEIQTAGLKAIRNQDGTMNMTALEIACKNSAFSEKMVKAAALAQYAKASGMKFDGNINEDNISVSQDQYGREVIEIVNKGDKNTSQSLKMTLPTGDGNRALVEMTTIDKEGKQVSLATDGMLNRMRTKEIDAKTGKPKSSEKYAMSDFYAQKSTYGVNLAGNLSDVFEKDGGSAFSPQNLEKARQQFVRNRQNSRPAKISSLK